MPSLSVEGLYRGFGPAVAIDHIDFRVEDGEFLTLLGPSGCGKTTTLSAIAGHDKPNGGRIRLGETVFFDQARDIYLPPEARNCGLVFQSYALWPHMSVFGNVAFPLKLRRMGKAAIAARVRQTLDLVEMGEMMDRFPHQLSGGQQQRVALARTLAYQPAMLLLDEPLSNLDAKLREKARIWLSRLQSQVRITTIYVTHDQAEAMALSDRIAVMSEGKIVQLGTPMEIYENPAHPFVADFIGSSNFLPGALMAADGEPGYGQVTLAGGGSVRANLRNGIGVGDSVLVAVRPDRIQLLAANAAHRDCSEGEPIKGRLTGRSYLGGKFLYEIAIGETLARVESARQVSGDEVAITIDAASATIFRAQDMKQSRRPAPA
ncbi:ABC transporter ATP-binding protein [Rhizobium sp. P32RR-XVIII]|uniref:ABC transporter ATP-binding protein n=1 Tax=Rhizobium sp. P32RR-XVIII TaxID=2726738 RepID=UPI0014576627|nr:ABC transporter ATP-binding protein [Rhizobium sp. P32RR-XVIII]NLS06076.1 ABC transporter ATP-binding protein [Rhizobium sp. P32RR-XVIII]